MAGLAPQTAMEINNQTGQLMRDFVEMKEKVGHYRDSMAGLLLTEPPFDMSAEDETLIKTAINQIDTALDAIDMTFINRLVGLF
jgi:hypothetical protein